MNPFDEVALEEAVRLRENGLADEVLAVSVGNTACGETLRSAMALGADRAILIENDADLQPLVVAKLLAALCSREQPTLVFCGKQAIDDDASQTGPMLAALMGWPQATAVSAISLNGDTATVECETDGGPETMKVTLPAVLSADLRLNEPRYVTLPNIMKAKKKPLETLTPEELNIDVTPRLITLRVTESPVRKAGIRVTGVAELLERLRFEAKVI